MYRLKDIQEGLQHLVGWEQSIMDDNVLPSELNETESGLYYQGAHPLLTLNNIKSVMPKVDTSSIAAYSATKDYVVGDMMKYSNSIWICQKACKGVKPDDKDFNSDYNEDYGLIYWKEYNQLAEFLGKAVNNGIATMTNEFMNRKTIDKSGKMLFEHKYFFDAVGRIKNRVPTSHCLVGYEIQPLKGMGVTTQLHKIGMQMTGASGIVRVYLFHSSQENPVKTFDLRVLKNGNYQWFNLNDAYLPYAAESGVGGTWYLCYHQDAMPEGMEAINISKDWSKEPCSGCNVGSVEDWRTMTKYIRVSPFRVAVEDGFTTRPKMFDIKDIVYTPQSCYGMNCEISIGCDLTDFIVSQRSIFASVLQKQVAYDLLKRIAFNPDVNVNRNQVNANRYQELTMELDGSTFTRSGGIRGDLKKAYDALELDTEGMDSACMACKRKGVRYTIA